MVYNLMLALGMLSAIAVFIFNFIKLKQTRAHIIIIITVYIVALVFSYFFSCIFELLTKPDIMYEFRNGNYFVIGLQYYVMLLFFLLISYAGMWLFKVDAYANLNALIPSTAIFIAISRIGCIVVGCCGGIEIGVEIFGITHYPTAEAECIFAFLMFLLVQFVFKNHRVEIYLIAYSIFRFITDYMRVITAGVKAFDIFTPVQFLAIITIAYMIFMIVNVGYGKKDLEKSKTGD